MDHPVYTCLDSACRPVDKHGVDFWPSDFVWFAKEIQLSEDAMNKALKILEQMPGIIKQCQGPDREGHHD